MGRLIAIGDIHGEYCKLKSLLDKLAPEKSDSFVFLGDYIDRGLYSKQVVDSVLELSKLCDCRFLKGNHEYFYQKTLEGDKEAEYFFRTYGGEETIVSYGSFENMQKIHGDFYNTLDVYTESENYIFIHGGIIPNVPLAESDEFQMLMIRERFIYHPTNLKKKVVFGHTPFPEPFVQADKIGIDTGSGKYEDGYITAFICDEEKFVFSDR